MLIVDGVRRFDYTVMGRDSTVTVFDTSIFSQCLLTELSLHSHLLL